MKNYSFSYVFNIILKFNPNSLKSIQRNCTFAYDFRVLRSIEYKQ